MKNLLDETILDLRMHQKELSDVLYVMYAPSPFVKERRMMKFKCDAEILNAILNFNYDDGYGSTVINDGLILRGADFWLERHEYDGSEWWEYKQLPALDEYEDVDVSDIRIKNRF